MEYILIAQITERFNQAFCFTKMFDANHQIKHRFCGKTGNRGLANVFDSKRGFSENQPQALFSVSYRSGHSGLASSIMMVASIVPPPFSPSSYYYKTFYSAGLI